MTATRRPCPFDIPNGSVLDQTTFDRLHAYAGSLSYTAHRTDGIGGTERLDDDGIVSLVGDAQHVVDLALDALDLAVDTARDHGWSWERIGKEFGTTRQAAQKRFGVKL